MKQIAILAVILLAVSAPSVAGPVADCAGGTLADYVALGAGGCKLGTYHVFDFSEADLSFGTEPISLADVLVTPVVGMSRSSLKFSTMMSSTNAAFESAIFYAVAGPLSGASLKLSGSSVKGTGVGLATNEICLGDAFDSGACLSDTTALIALQTDGFADLTSFAKLGVQLAGIRQSLIADAGPDGSATFDQATVTFATPEPSSLILMACALAALVCVSKNTRRPV
jgi:hypothetical protein